MMVIANEFDEDFITLLHYTLRSVLDSVSERVLVPCLAILTLFLSSALLL